MDVDTHAVVSDVEVPAAAASGVGAKAWMVETFNKWGGRVLAHTLLPTLSPEALQFAVNTAKAVPDADAMVKLWKVERAGTCTKRLGSGAYGSVFRACQDAPGCTQCIAIKFGQTMKSSGLVEDGTTAGHELTVRDEMNGVSVGEVRATQAVTAAVIDTKQTPHVMRFVHAVAAPAGGYFLLVQYVPPLELAVSPLATLAHVSSKLMATVLGDPAPRPPALFATMRDVMTNYPEFQRGGGNLRFLVFQMLWTLEALQSTFDGFRHNDDKDDNWLVTGWDGADHTYALFGGGKWRLPAQKVQVKLIDFGITSSNDARVFDKTVAETNPDDPDDSFASAGVIQAPCPLYDPFLMFESMMLSARRGAESRGEERLHPDIVEFFTSVIVPVFPREYRRPPLSDNSRLTVQGQRQIPDDISRNALLFETPRDMLALPYFESLVDKVVRMGVPAGRAEYNI